MDGQFSGRKLNFRILLVLAALCCVVLVGKLFVIQVFATSYYRKASIDNSVRIVPIRAPRGMIVDRNNQVIVQNRPSYAVYLLPHEVPDIDSTAARLAVMLGMDIQYLKDIISTGWKGKFQPIRLKRDVDFKTISVLEEHSLDIPGVVYRSEPARLYPDSGYGSHVIGYVGEVSEEELAQNQSYIKSEIIGKKGLERFYNQQLKGRDGVSYLEVTALGRVLGKYADREEVTPVKGATLMLNLDWPLQKLAENLLKEQGQGAIVVLGTNDGGVLAMASSPEYDANLFSGVLSPEEWAAIMTDSTHPLLNRAIQGIYPPGSAMKPFTAAMALRYDRVNAENKFDSCRGQKRFGDRIFKCWKPQGHGKLALVDAIVQSCDVYFYQLGLACGMELWEKFMPACGFGKLTGIDIPGEKTGNSPTIAYFNERYGEHGWTRYLMNNLAIGQGEILVTPLQMAVFYAALANGGDIYRPRLVKKVIDGDGGTIEFKPERIDTLPVSQDQLQILVEALHGVVSEPHGTAHWMRLPWVSIAGKTGTAQNPHGEDHAWFVCFAPVEDPEIAIAVLVENAGHGSSEAAPLARKLIQYYFPESTDQLVHR